ncbi:MAG: Na/Pi symporter [Gammaproteobacteria bacterium]
MFALNIAGGVCLLLWGSYMVRMGVERAYASRLGALVSGATGSRARAFVSGVFSAALLQSATAAILLTASLVTAGLLPLATALAVILGADVGSAIAVRILYLDLSFLPPLLFCAGLGMFRLSGTWRQRQLGRIFFGLGLILLAIQLLRQSVAASMPPDELLAALGALPWIALLVAALLTWAAHSSVAVVLIIAALADAGLVNAPLFVFLVVGANIGAGLIALSLVGRRHHDSYAAVLANFFMRAALGLAALAFAHFLEGNLHLLGATPGARIINAHLAFNLALALLFVPLGARIARAVKWLVVSHSPEAPLHDIAPGAGLDPALIAKPKQALSCARREAFRLADNAEALYAGALGMFEAGDRAIIEGFVARDAEINARNKAIQRYLAEVRRHAGDGDVETALDQILRFAATMENIGDLVTHNMARLALKRLERGARFSSAGEEELHALHGEVLKVIQLDITNFAAGDQLSRKAARKQIKAALELGRESIARHRRRLSERKVSSIDSSSIHQDMVRDLMHVVRYIENREAS